MIAEFTMEEVREDVFKIQSFGQLIGFVSAMPVDRTVPNSPVVWFRPRSNEDVPQAIYFTAEDAATAVIREALNGAAIRLVQPTEAPCSKK